MPYAVVLNSRQSKTPVGSDPWVVSTLQAVRYAVDRGYIIVSSLGMNTWELVTWTAGACGGRLLIYIPYPYAINSAGISSAKLDDPQSCASVILSEYHLSQKHTEFRFQDPPDIGRMRKSHWPDRDVQLLAMADIVFPVAIRPGGGLESLLAAVETRAKVDNRFRVEYHTSAHHPSYPPAGAVINPALRGQPWPYVTHWTRAAAGKWPGEHAAAYYRDIVNSRNGYTRSALETLNRILGERRLRATNRHIRGGYSVVSFTALLPREAIKLMRWRSRYVQWSFEPYGIAIDRKVALSIGIQPVIYGEPSEYSELSELERPFFQNRGMRAGDWAAEHEWRHSGDLNLALIPRHKIGVITQFSADSAALALEDYPTTIALYGYLAAQ